MSSPLRRVAAVEVKGDPISGHFCDLILERSMLFRFGAIVEAVVCLLLVEFHNHRHHGRNADTAS